jgi:hypothetical protein
MGRLFLCVNMAANYRFAEMAGKLLCYGREHGNVRRLYEEKFPGRLIPDARMFTSNHRNLKERVYLSLHHVIEREPEQCVLRIWKTESWPTLLKVQQQAQIASL